MKTYIPQFLIVLLLAQQPAWSQDLPKFITISDDRSEIKTASGDVSGFYDESELKKLYLNFDESNFWSLLESYYDTENYVYATLSYEDEILFDVGVQFKGNTSYRRLDRDDEKMSFSIKTDLIHEDQDLDGYSNLNLNNAFQDNSTMREVVYAHLCRQHIPAPQANFIELYINGEYWGPYTNVQQVNKDMLEDWFLSNDGARFRADSPAGTNTGGGGGGGGGGPQWGDGTAALNYLGDDTTLYQQYYTLKSTDIEGSWEKLVDVCDVLNNTPIESLESTVRDYLDIDRTLWFLAHEIIYSDDDSYIHKGKQDYYVYYEPETGRFTPLEFDGNSAMGLNNVNWDVFTNENNENYPLLNRLLSIPSLRQRYLAHVRTILNEEMNLDEVFALIDQYAALIDASVQADPKKLMTYSEFVSGVEELKSFFTQRKAFIESNDEVDMVGVKLNDVSQMVGGVDRLPMENESVNITADIGTADVSELNLYYSVGIVGNFFKISMKDNGSENDGSANDGVFGASIPGQPSASLIRYYIEVIGNDAINTVTYLPTGAEHSSFVYQVQYNMVTDPVLVINEILASNDNVVSDEMDEYDDYIELFNKSNLGVSLDGYFLTDDLQELNKYALPTATIDANDYYLVWADDDPEQGDNHANFKLSADGEVLYLVNSNDEIVDALTFGEQTVDISYGRTPNGNGDFAIMLPTPLAENSDELDEIPEVTLSTDPLQESQILFFPNPVSHVLAVDHHLQPNIVLKIYSLSGHIVYQRIPSKEETLYVDVSKWERGVYLIQAGEIVEKLIVK